MAEDHAAMGPIFEPFDEDDETGVAIIDPIERHRYTLRTDDRTSTSVAVSPTNTEQFPFPVDSAVTIRTAALGFPSAVLTHVRDAAGEALASTEQFAYEEFPAGQYTIELHTPIKLYLRVESPVTVRADFERTVIEFGDVTSVAVGARSYHDHPAATVTTTTDPEDMMAAVSTFGSALKTTSPERAYPTLRGHPPAIELGDELSIPKGLDRPNTNVTIELPAALEYIYPAAPLAYYLGAELVPGEEPRLCAGTDFEHALDSGRGFENEVERVLKQTFFLDCLTRTEGIYGTDLHERRALESDPAFANADLDFATLYDASAVERLAAYLDVSYEVIEPYLPEWKLTSHTQPIPTSVETLPFVTHDLAIVRTPGPDDLAPVSAMEASEFDKIASPSADGGFTHSGKSSSGSHGTSGPGSPASDEFYVQLPSADSHEQAWIGEGTPVNASKATIEAYENRLDRTPNQDDIAVTVVCNGAGMGEEQEVVDEIYGSSASLPFDVTVHNDLTRAELQDLLGTPTELLHYVGHIDEDGFTCADGKLDATTLTAVNVDAFLLNTCHSYEQGMALIEAGAIGGIVTLNELFNSGAVQMGCTLARLLNAGFPLRAALEIARDDSIMGKQYLVIGDGGLTIGQPEIGGPGFCEIERTTDGFQVTHRAYPTEERGMGCTVALHLPSSNEYYLSSTRSPTVEVSRDELVQFLSFEDIPVRINGTLQWSSQIDLEKL
jgi:hypothetical protein